MKKKRKPTLRKTRVEVLRLSKEDQILFAKAILNPPAPSAALKRAAKRHRELFGT